MKRIVLILGLILLGLILVFFAVQDRFVTRAFNSMVSERVGIDETADFADGLYVFIGGAGGPMADRLRDGPTLGVLAGDRAFIIDAGTGGIRNLGQMGFPIDRTEVLYLTHLHSDHIDGLGETLLQSWIGGTRATPLPVIGPVGTEDVVAGFNQAYARDSEFRTAHHGVDVADPAGFGGIAQEIAALDSQILLEESDLKITSFTVEHDPVDAAFGYRIDYKDRSVSISGDTRYSDNLVRQSDGVDVLFHEALSADMVATIGEAASTNGAGNLAKIFADIPDYHTTPEDAARAATQAKAEALVLYHIVPALPSKRLNSLFLGEAVRLFSGRITVSKDGLLVALPAGEATIGYEDRL